MKAILVTRCGCSRMVNVPDGAHEWNVPFLSHYNMGAFRHEKTQHLDEWSEPQHRRFVLDKSENYIGTEPIALFREQP